MLSRAEVAATVASIEAVQCRDGLIPWFDGGHADPWNHVEAAMALATGGRWQAAERAYDWLAGTQRADGAWHQYYLPGRGSAGPTIEVALLDANVTAYVATGTWHHFLTTGDRGFLESMWPVVVGAMGFVLDLQRGGGEVIWARHPDGTPWSFALLTASSSTYRSLGCAVAMAEELGRDRPDWVGARSALGQAVADRPDAFLPKDRWAMDWYYPVLAGALDADRARARLDEGWDRFVMDGLGVRCVADRPWVTAAETAECALAHVAAGLVGPDDPDGLDGPADGDGSQTNRANRLMAWTRHLRAADGSYLTGMVHPEEVAFPGGEFATYSAAAVVLATDALRDPHSAAARIFSPVPAGDPTRR